MKIVFDLMHPAHVNFFRNSIRTLQAQGHEVMLTVLRRGKVPAIVSKEFPDLPVTYIGKHKGTTYSILFEANVFRFFSMMAFLFRNKPDLGLSVGSFILGSGMKLLGKRNIQFDDDPERKANVTLEKLTSSELYFPAIYKDSSEKVKYFNCLKEWAYLSPRYFTPDPEIPKAYGVNPGEYIFVREVSTGSLNYQGQKDNLIARFAHQLPERFKYVLSLEDKSTRDRYPADWIVLQEPVTDIHSIMYFSRCAISSGDSMAREAAMLGVPSVYCGIREMKANTWMQKEGNLYSRSAQVPELISELIKQQPATSQVQFRKNLVEKWDDVTGLILQRVGA